MSEMKERGFNNATSSAQLLRPSGWSALADSLIEATTHNDLPTLHQVFSPLSIEDSLTKIYPAPILKQCGSNSKVDTFSILYYDYNKARF